MAKYFVDWDDKDFPEIRNIKFDPHGDAIPRSLADCQKEIVEHFKNEISYARAHIRNTRALRASDIEA